MKIIEINSCSDCPYFGKCVAWKALTAKQRVAIVIGNSTPVLYILAKCPLKDAPTVDGE